MEKTPATKKEPSKDLKGEDSKERKHHVTLFAKVKRRINTTRLVLGMLSILLYTVFTVVMLLRNWGSTVYLAVILGLVGLYILLFAVLLLIQRKTRVKFDNSLKNYKSGLKIIKSLLVLINFGLTVSVFIQAAGAQDIGTPFQITVLIITLTWAIFQIVYQTSRMRKRHRALKQKAKKN